MCKIGDIIIVDEYKDNGNTIPSHSFVVVNDENGEIQGLPYDFVANVLSSFKSEEQKNRKLSYPGNFPITSDDTITSPHNNRNGYVKVDQMYYFTKDKISYKVIGYMKPDIFNILIEFIEESDFDISDIIDNL